MVTPARMPLSTTAASATPTQGKILVLCFDGTTNAFDNTNTNVAKLFQMLDKSEPSKQLCYYQPGVGTYSLPSIVTPITSFVTKVIDSAVAWFFATHVTGGYRFIADNYQPGDKICMFGFSRGSYTARALAGMIEKVGLIPADNHEQLQFAWRMYKSKSQKSIPLAKTFKETFSRDVDVDFIGVWDTVSSVGGIIEHHYPYTNQNKSIRIFRHALSLDERRVKLSQNRYHVHSSEPKYARDDPEAASVPSTGIDSNGKPYDARDDYKADVKEVYFAGDHTDVGGGEYKNDEPRMLSNITLEWMLQQIIRSPIGIRFHQPSLDKFMASYANSTSHLLVPCLSNLPDNNTAGSSNNDNDRSRDDPTAAGVKINGDGTDNPPPHYANENIIPAVGDNLAIQSITGLITVPFWWLLEFFPFKRKYQDLSDEDEGKNSWKVTFVPNFGRPRIVAPGSKIHESVRDKMALEVPSGKKYVPKAKLPDRFEWVSSTSY